MPATSRPEPIPRAVVFDGDDTLWKTEHLYDDARSLARRVIVDAGIDGAEWEELERQIDVQNVAIFGFGLERFPTSCVQAYEEICRRHFSQIDLSISHKVREAALSAFDPNPPLIDGALEALIALKNCDFRLALLSKGIPELQLRRIRSNGLENRFDVIKIVDEKTPEVISDLLKTLGASPESSWMVGNSLRSDILPALSTGMHVIWIRAHTWEYERAFDHLFDKHFREAESVAEVPELILRQNNEILCSTPS